MILGFAFVLVQLTVFDSAGVRRTLFVISCITLALIVKNAALLFEGEIPQSIGAIADFAGGYAGGPVSPIGPQLWIFSLSTALLLNFVLVARQGLERELARVGVFSCSFTVLCSIYFSNISSLAVQLQSSLVGLTVAILSWIILVSRLDSHTPPAFQSIGSIRLTRFFIAIPLVLSITNNGFATNLDRLVSEDGGAMSVIEATQNRIFVLLDRNQVTKSELGLVLEFANVHSFIAQVPTLIPLTDPIFRSNPTIPCSSELKKLIVQDNLLETLSCKFTILDRHQNLVLVGT